MTLREWLDVYTHNGDAQLVCAWRKRAWRAMRPIVEQFVADREAGIKVSVGRMYRDIEHAATEASISLNGKRWEEEWRKLVRIMQSERELWPTPTQEEADVAMVVRDLEEMGELERAAALLREQAPNARNRKCPACGRKPGEPCRDLATETALIAPHAARVTA